MKPLIKVTLVAIVIIVLVGIIGFVPTGKVVEITEGEQNKTTVQPSEITQENQTTTECIPTCQWANVCDESAPDECGGTCTRDTDGVDCSDCSICSNGLCEYQCKVEEECINDSCQTPATPTCPSSCDDDNPCTKDYCSEATNYECKHDLITPCCGNDVCELGENHTSCPEDCLVPAGEDTTPPVFENLSISPRTIIDGGTVSVDFDVYDDLSGFKIGSVNWKNSTGWTIWGWTIGENLSELPIEIEISPYQKAGIYHIDISLTDKANNRITYHGDKDFDGAFEVKKSQPETTPFVTRVIDGDTVELQTGEKVRLLGINAPESGQKCYEESKQRLRELVEGKEVTLEKDVDDKDQYGRLLRYVFIDSSFVNLFLVKEGLANVYILEPNTKYAIELEEAENYAKNNQIGCLWQVSKLTCADCIGISYFHYNAEGNDCYNLNDEYVVFKNTCDFDCGLTSWTVKDEANHIYTYPSFVLGGGKTVTLFTGCGTSTESELYWCNSGYACNAIWNNDGDTLYLRDSEGNLILSYSY